MQKRGNRGVGRWVLVGLLLWGWSNSALASRRVGEALPKGADIALVFGGAQWDAFLELHSSQSEHWSGRSSMTDIIDNTEGGLRSWRHYLAEGTSLDWGKENRAFLLWADISFTTSPVAAGLMWTKQVILPHSNSELGWSSFEIDGNAAHRLNGDDFCWAQLKEVLVYGHCLPMKRQLRHLSLGRENKGALGLLMKRYHQGGAGLYWSLGKKERLQMAEMLGAWGAFLASVNAGYIEARADFLEMRFGTSNAREQKGVIQALYGVFDLFLGELHQLKARVRLGEALDIFRKKSLKTTLVNTDDRFVWASDQKITSVWKAPEIHGRFSNAVDGKLAVPDWDVLQKTTMSLLSRSSVERNRQFSQLSPEQILKKLRQLEWEYRDAEGSFVECGPIPRVIPKTKVQWPEKSCFAPLGFWPGSRVGYQLSAAVLRGKLQLVLRQDLNGDGIPTIWVLGEEAETPRRYGAD